MSNVIKILKDSTINKIAAGEVVEAPYSVVKELIENAIDARATNIIIEIKEGGQKYIRVSDNGEGIYEEDVETAFMRHATSKIMIVEDLSSVLTLGFRGEALASIAAVSQTQIITKPQKQLHGISMDIAGGNIINKRQVGAPDGTTIIVENLFFNVPARLKFMKSAQAESTRIGEIISRLALSKPNIAFKYINNNNIMFTTPGNNNMHQTILSVLGKELSKNLLPISTTTDIIKVDGFISQPIYVRGNRNFEIAFVNGRYVKSNLISKAVEDAYKEKLLINKFPVYILNIDIDQKLVDVNVHPTKTEVKIQEEGIVYQHIYDIVHFTLRKNSVVPSLMIKNDNNDKNSLRNQTYCRNSFKENKSVYNTYNNDEFDVSQIVYVEQEEEKISFNNNDVIDISISTMEENRQLQNKISTDIEITQESFLTNLLKDYKVIGQLFNTYIIIEKEFSMILIDQHAGHERLVYNKMIQQHKNNNIITQRLLEPKILELSSEDYSFIIQYLDKFKNIGFEIESFGINALIIREVPLVMGVPKGFDFLFEVIDELKKGNYGEEYFNEVIARKSCREAIKASDKLSISEINELIKELSKLKPPLTCPHGRPILLSLTKYEIEKNFKRIQ